MTHPLARLAQEIVDRTCPEETRLRKGMVTKHPDGRTVKIVDGYFLGQYGGLSNHFSWREVMPDGSLSDTLEWGYGWRTTEEGRTGWLEWNAHVGQRHEPAKEQPIGYYKCKLAEAEAKIRKLEGQRDGTG